MTLTIDDFDQIETVVQFIAQIDDIRAALNGADVELPPHSFGPSSQFA